MDRRGLRGRSRPPPVNRKDRRSEMFRLALGTTTGLGRPRPLRKREPTVATLRGLYHQLLAVRLHRLTDMREVRFDLPLRNPESPRELTGLPRTPPEQCDDLLSECRCPVCHRASSLYASSCVRSYTTSTPCLWSRMPCARLCYACGHASRSGKLCMVCVYRNHIAQCIALCRWLMLVDISMSDAR